MFKPLTGFQKITYLPRKQMSSDSGSQLADDLCRQFGNPSEFMFFRGIIKKVGEQLVREWASDAKMSKNPIARFKWLFKDFWSGIKWS